MISPIWTVFAHWMARREESAECAGRLEQFLRELAQEHSLLGTWFLKGTSRNRALKAKVGTSADELLRLLERGASRRDTDRAPMPELGVSLSCWNGGDPGEDATLSVHCGADSPYVGNGVSLNLPSQEGFSTNERVRRVLELSIRLWRPEVAGVRTFTQLPEFDPSDSGSIDWMVYRSGFEYPCGRLPDRAHVEELPVLGRLVIVSNGSADWSSKERVETTLQIRKAFGLSTSGSLA